MKNESLLSRGNISKPKKNTLIAEAKLVTENMLLEKQNQEAEVKNYFQENKNLLSVNSYLMNKKLSKPKSVNRLLNSVKKITGVEEEKLVYIPDEPVVVIPEVNEEIEYKFVVTPIEIESVEPEPKPIKVIRSKKILEIAQQWDFKNTSPVQQIEQETIPYQEELPVSSNPKLLKRLFNSKRRVFGE